MAQHGYLREYDEGWDRGDDRDRDRDRGRDWRSEDRDRGWSTNEDDWRERDRGWRDSGRGTGQRSGNFMLGGHDRGEHGRDDSSRSIGDRARSWFRDDDRDYRRSHEDDWGGPQGARSSGYGREHGYGGSQGNYGRSHDQQGGFGGRGDWERAPRGFSSHQDDHYRSWRDRQMSALDRDYADYCREREQRFHEDFDSWRQNRENRPSSGQQQHQQRQQSGQGASEEVMELNNPTDLSTEPQSGPSPTADATLGTNNSENSGIGRGSR